MYITPINSQPSMNSKINFKSTTEITKKMLENTPREIKNTISGAITEPPGRLKEFIDADSILKKYGITYLNTNALEVNIATGQYGFFTIKTLYNVPKCKLKDYVAMLLNVPKGIGGLSSYIGCVKDLKRQDIIMKGAGIQSHEVNMLVPEEKHYDMTRCFSKYFNDPYFNEELFYMNNRAFYYDRDKKTIYNIHTDLSPNRFAKQHVTECKFVTDDKGNAIGYDRKEWDLYADAYKEIKYREQSEPSQELPKVADPYNNKIFAECFKFGNAEINRKTLAGTTKVIEHLKNKAKISTVDESQLQYVKFYDKNKDVQERICYFNPVSGRSIVYNNKGEYLYQLEYIKDNNGILRACSRM